MIISEQKPIEDILKALSPYKKIFIIGCGDCATTCRVGGEEEVADMKKFLSKNKKTITGTVIIETGCDERLAKKALNENKTKVKQSDAVLVLSCGAGTQTTSDLLEIPVLTGTNSLFIAKIKNLRNFTQKCETCGDCLLNNYGGICPITQCPKSILNGPCGGAKDGKCEVDPDVDCGWVLIYERLKKLDQLKHLKNIRLPRDYSKSHKPKYLTLYKK